MEYTRAQQNTIDAENCSLIVAAGAGSGKTRVLTDRIISKLLDDKTGAEITEFLVVTFTKAAAKELSDRIRTSLVKKSEEGGKTDNIIKNLALLPQAKICTIDAFCYDLVKENFQKLGISPKTRIADENETAVIIERIFTEIIEERMRLEEGHEYFLPLYEVLSDKKSDSAFLKSLKDLYIKISNNANVKKFFENACGIYDEICQKDEIFATRYGHAFQEHVSEKLGYAKDLINEAKSACEADGELVKILMPALDNESERINILLSSLYSAYDDFCYSLANLNQAKAVSIKKATDQSLAKAIYDKCSAARSIINEVKNNSLAARTELLKKCAKDCANLAKELSDIMFEFDERFMKEKKEYGILDFADVEKLTLEILYDDEELKVESGKAKTLQNAFTEIYIDEYQDTNRIQDMIFRALTKKDGNGNECNRFMVGDSKQSIYGFRGARPDIFNGYKEEFGSFGDGSSRQKIFMNDNFRCAENIITFTNALFEKVMPGEYGSDEHLTYAKVEETKKEDSPVKLLICKSTEEKADASERIRMQAEAIYNEICGLYNNENILGAAGKPYKYEDMAILTQRWVDARFLEKYFSDKNIPVSCEKGENFFDRREVNIALNILGAVDNPERDVCIAGFMRSKAGGFDDNELAKIRNKTKDGSFYHAVREYGENGENEELKSKIAEFCEKLSLLRKLSRSSSVSDFIKTLYSKTDIMSICTSKDYENGVNDSKEVRKKNLLKLYEIARSYDKTVFKGLSSFLEYLEPMKSSDNVKSCNADDADRIKIMTVHKSKGLEFPVCFVFGAERAFTKPSDKLIYLDKKDKSGIGFDLKNIDGIESVPGSSGNYKVATPFKNLFAEYLHRDELLEAKRLMYVALTRAKERLIITSAVNNFEKTVKDRKKPQENCKSQLDWILSAFSDEETLVSFANDYGELPENGKNYGFFEISVRTFGPVSKNDVKKEKTVEKGEEKADSADKEMLKAVKDVLEKRINAVNRIAAVPPKVTVSLLKNGLIDYDEAAQLTQSERKLITKPEYASGEKTSASAEKGTAMHMFMQFANYAECEKDGCEKQAEKLCEDGFITEKQKELLDISKLEDFFKSDLYGKIKKARKIYRERRFNLLAKPGEVIEGLPSEVGKDEFVLIQGVIDCFIEMEDGNFAVIDFKTDRVSGDNAEEILVKRYANQLKFYCKAVKDITKKEVSEAVIFSFDLMKSIKLAKEVITS